MTMRTVVTWLWAGNRAYLPEHVNVLAAMFRRHLTLPHRFVCITDMSDGFDSDIDVMPMPAAAKDLGKFHTPEGGRFPSCYRRLWMFSSEAKCLGKRVLMVDIDLVLTGNIDHLFAPRARFVGWQPKASWGGTNRIGGGMYLMTPGAHTEVFDDFKGMESIIAARAAGFRGSDQAWISHKLVGKVKLWPSDAGIYSIRDLKDGQLPDDACLVQFNGTGKPWHGRPSWTLEHWKK